MYIGFTQRVDVYRKDATGPAVPVRTITGLPVIASIALDRFGNLYVAEAGSWTVREFAPNASGNARPTHVFTAIPPFQPLPSELRFTYDIAVRYDGGIALLGARAGLTYEALVGGVINPHDDGYDILFERPGPNFAHGMALDGAGELIFGLADSSGGYPNTKPMIFTRYSPHPTGFRADGQIGSIADIGNEFAIAASNGDALQMNAYRCNGSDAPTVTCSTRTSLVPFLEHVAFDAEGRLFGVSRFGSRPGYAVAVLPAAVHDGQLPLRTFYPTYRAEDFNTSGIAVTQ